MDFSGSHGSNVDWLHITGPEGSTTGGTLALTVLKGLLYAPIAKEMITFCNHNLKLKRILNLFG